ncbi:MAG: hypothetical protein NWE89_08910 [Candidatus Bathyarchaeota archaeon]|nr:hypothetical protein [Candidatus Bathyarchaeota archaeon]
MAILPDEYVLGVDGGGTWTRSIIMRLDGTVLGKGSAGPSNPLTIGMDAALENITQAVDEAKSEADVKSFKASRLGLAGGARSVLGDRMVERLPENYGDTGIISDTESALAGSTGCRPGVVVIAGTGSNVYGKNAQGEEAKAGGWGWRLGDEGSGYTIGKNAIIAALEYHDGRGPYTTLKESILRYLEIKDIEEIIDWTYDSGREPRHFASLVPLVKEAEKSGDKVAAKIMMEVGAQLGGIAQVVVRRLGLTGAFPVAYVGGVFKQPLSYNVAFEEKVRQVAPDCQIIEPLFSPTVGSALLALIAMGIDVDDDLLNNVKTSFTGRGDVNE